MRLRAAAEFLVLAAALQMMIGLAMYVLAGSKGEFITYAPLLVLPSSALGICVYMILEKAAAKLYAADRKEHAEI
jgi:hypothetical protein